MALGALPAGLRPFGLRPLGSRRPHAGPIGETTGSTAEPRAAPRSAHSPRGARAGFAKGIPAHAHYDLLTKSNFVSMFSRFGDVITMSNPHLTVQLF